MSSLNVTFLTAPVSGVVASTGATPGHLASEHLDPALVSFAAATSGSMCGGVSAASLAQTAAPSVLTGSSLTSCSQHYGTNNTMLDVIVGGCTLFAGNAVNPTQPDTFDSSRTSTGGYRFTEDTLHHVTACTKNGVADTLADCLAAAAYSMSIQFNAGRVIIK